MVHAPLTRETPTPTVREVAVPTPTLRPNEGLGQVGLRRGSGTQESVRADTRCVAKTEERVVLGKSVGPGPEGETVEDVDAETITPETDERVTGRALGTPTPVVEATSGEDVECVARRDVPTGVQGEYAQGREADVGPAPPYGGGRPTNGPVRTPE